jgi:F-type H+-transporting ATPase subunit a
MEEMSHFGPKKVLIFFDGKLFVTETVILGAILAVIIAVVLLWLAKDLHKQPSSKQMVAEIIVEFIYNLTRNTMGPHNIAFAPYIGTIFIFILMGNMLGLLGLRPVTTDVNTTFALSLLTFILIEYNSIKSMGLKGKFLHMCAPFPWYVGGLTMFPLKIIEALSRPVSLGFRLFGNILGGFIVMELLFGALAGLSHFVGLKFPAFVAVIPLPANFFFDMFEPVVQAYIFTMLTMVFISMEIIRHEAGEHH